MIMKFTRKQWLRAVVAGSVGPLLAAAATSAAHGADADNPNRFNASGRFLFNVKADFMHLATPANPGPGVGVHAGDHVYDDGYVKVDESGNAGNATWNWGFQKPSSVVGTSLELHSSRSPADGLTQRKSDEPQSGFEVSYGRVLKSVDVCGKPMRLGLLGAFGMTFLDIRNSSSITGATTGVKDTYDLSGLPLIPNAPYAGSTPVLGGPLPLLLPDAPTARTPVNVAATATERMKVSGNLYGLKVGPFAEFPVSDAVSVQVQGGFAALLADGEFAWSEEISTGGAGTGSASKNAWRYGGFVEGQVNVALGRNWSAFAGAGWQNVGNYSVQAGSKAVKVKLDSAISGFAGLSYSF